MELAKALKKIHNLAKKARLIVFLKGELGAGKTFLVRSFIQTNLGKNVLVSSPTFLIVRKLNISNNSVYHLDFYRVQEELKDENKREILFEEIGFWEIFDDADIVFIEWGENIKNLINETFADDFKILEIEISSAGKERKYNVRELTR